MAEQVEKAPLKVYRVLIVDDDRSLLKMLRHQLEEAGYEVLVAESGREALRVFFEYKPDLVILDTRMPEMDGYPMFRLWS